MGEEGVDLQRGCNTIIHYDLEWNPAKVEQREGRVDRLGRLSKEPVQVRTMLLEGKYHERIYARCENRKLWMELYLCKHWKDEGKNTEEENFQPDPLAQIDGKDLEHLRNYRLDLSPVPLNDP